MWLAFAHIEVNQNREAVKTGSQKHHVKEVSTSYDTHFAAVPS